MVKSVFCLLLSAGLWLTAETQNLAKNGNAEAGLENWDNKQVQLVTENPHSGKNCFKTVTSNVLSTEPIPVNTDNVYTISGWFKSVDDKKVALYLGFMPLNEDKKQIQCFNVLPMAGVPETELVQECISSDTILKVKDASKWQFNQFAKIAFDVDTSGEYKDLPNFNIYTGKILGAENKGTYWELKLEKPCNNSFPVKTKIREHRDGATYIYSVNKMDFNSQTWQQLSGTTRDYSNVGMDGGKFWKGTKYVKIMVLSNGGAVYFDDIKLEEKK